MVANFVVLCYVWSLLSVVFSTCEDILDSYSKNVYIYTRQSNDFWGPVTIVCDHDNMYDYNTSITNVSLYNLSHSQDSNDIYTTCDDYIRDNFGDKVSGSQDYFSLYYLHWEDEEKNGGKIKKFKKIRESSVYTYSIILGVFEIFVVLLLFCVEGIYVTKPIRAVYTANSNTSLRCELELKTQNQFLHSYNKTIFNLFAFAFLVIFNKIDGCWSLISDCCLYVVFVVVCFFSTSWYNQQCILQQKELIQIKIETWCYNWRLKLEYTVGWQVHGLSGPGVF